MPSQAFLAARRDYETARINNLKGYLQVHKDIRTHVADGSVTYVPDSSGEFIFSAEALREIKQEGFQVLLTPEKWSVSLDGVKKVKICWEMNADGT